MSRKEEDELHRAYVTQLRSEHQRVNRCLTRVEKGWERARQTSRAMSDLDELIAGLVELRAELAQHFSDEEAGGCVEEAVTNAPLLGRQADRVEREDRWLLRQIDSLIGELPSQPKSIAKHETRYRQLMQRIRDHEAAESRIVEASFGMDVD